MVRAHRATSTTPSVMRVAGYSTTVWTVAVDVVQHGCADREPEHEADGGDPLHQVVLNRPGDLGDGVHADHELGGDERQEDQRVGGPSAAASTASPTRPA